MIKAQIVDGYGKGVKAKVTSLGQLIVAPLSYDLTEFKSLDVINTAYNFYSPKPNMQFVITSMLAFATKDVSDASDTIIQIYEAGSETEITVLKTLIQFGMGKLTNLPLTPLNILVNEGVWINAKTDDNTINITIMGYYIDKL